MEFDQRANQEVRTMARQGFSFRSKLTLSEVEDFRQGKGSWRPAQFNCLLFSHTHSDTKSLSLWSPTLIRSHHLAIEARAELQCRNSFFATR